MTRAPSAVADGILPGLDAIVLRALVRTPRARFATARAMAEELAAAVSPATPAEVAAWLHRVVGDALELTEERVARIERHEPTGEGTQSAASARSLEGLARPAPRSTDDAATLAAPAHPPRRRWRAWVRAGAVALAALAVTAFVLSGGLGARRARVSPEVQLGAASPGASSSSAPASVSIPAASEVAQAMGAPSAAAAPPAAPSLVSATPKAARPPAPRAPRSATSATTAGTPPAQALCSPPFLFDADGHKIYKPECFH